MLISVIICTHNPRLSHLERVLAALRAQTLAATEWELLLIDNASDQSFRKEIDLDWLPRARCLREEKIGLTHARRCGIAESRGECLVFVDDDNVLQPDYLAKVLEIAREHSRLGAWSGQVLPEFEITPPDEIKPFLGVLCLRKLERDFWGNTPVWGHVPWGAGMCVRREVAQRYQQEVRDNPLRLALGHAGNRVSCHDDTDLALTGFDLGLGTGLFRALVLTHLIPTRRLKEEYLLTLMERSAAAFVVLRRVRGIAINGEPNGVDRWIKQLEYWRGTSAQKKIADARRRGEAAGHEMAAHLPMPPAACPVMK